MKKLRLAIDDLSVESFDAGSSSIGGTVVAHTGGPPTGACNCMRDPESNTQCTNDDCTAASCHVSCAHTCDAAVATCAQFCTYIGTYCPPVECM